jgi:hypothetical protein
MQLHANAENRVHSSGFPSGIAGNKPVEIPVEIYSGKIPAAVAAEDQHESEAREVP